jgi:hypothetical protein
MTSVFHALLLAVGMSILVLPSPAHARSKLSAVGSALSSKLARDVQRDAATKALPLARPRMVHRYTTIERARHESRHGIPPSTHMTSKARPGRPLSSESAKNRFGLPRVPNVRETIRLPRGTLVRPNKVLGGQPGFGELTSPRRIPPGAIVRLTPVK